MRCLICGSKTKILGTRHVRHTIRRRRECPECLTRFTTRETIEISSIMPLIQAYTRKKAAGVEDE
jgi:transcriptional repressor NrdR